MLAGLLIFTNSGLSEYCHNNVTNVSGCFQNLDIIHSIYNVLMSENNKNGYFYGILPSNIQNGLNASIRARKKPTHGCVGFTAVESITVPYQAQGGC